MGKFSGLAGHKGGSMIKKTWLNIPDGSTFQVSIDSPEDAQFSDAGELAIDGNLVAKYSFSELQTGITVPLRSPHRYAFNIDLFFLGNDAIEATVQGSLLDSEDTPIIPDFALPASGSNNDHEVVQLSAITAL
jgi:hypothetical protein